VGEGESVALLDIERWDDLKGKLNWKKFLAEKDTEGVEAVRLATHRGRPLASDTFLSKLETKLNRRLRPLASGRPKGKKDSKKRLKKG
jgi:hypothetical protein